MNAARFVLLGAIAAAMSACSASRSPAKPDAGSAARRRVRIEMLVTTDWLAEHLRDSDVAVVHVGCSPEAPDAADRPGYDGGHIPGARFVTWEEIATDRNGLPNELPALQALVSLVRRLGITEDDRIILYDTGAGLESARAFVTLDYLGLGHNAALLDGHWKKWRDEGRPTSQEVPNVKPSTFLPRPFPQVTINLSAMQDLVWLANQPDSEIVIVDARPEDEYSGAKPGKGVGRPGHIPAAVNIHWMSHVVGKDNPVLQSQELLWALYDMAGARTWGLVIAYCRTGGQASHTYFTAKYLGYDVRLYDGSFVEWSGKPELPVERKTAMKR